MYDDFAFEMAYGDGDVSNLEADTPIVFEEVKPIRLISMAEVRKHNTPEDCWTVLHDQVFDLTKFAKGHIGGVGAITKLAGIDGTAIFARAHGKNVLSNLIKDQAVCLGDLDLSIIDIPLEAAFTLPGGTAAVSVADSATIEKEVVQADTPHGHTLEEVALHNSKDDCWVVVHGQVLDVTDFLKFHPGGETSILALAGKDATMQFDMVHTPEMIGKYAPETVIGKLHASSPLPELKAVASVSTFDGGSGTQSDNEVESNASSPLHKDDSDSDSKVGQPIWCPCCRELMQNSQQESGAAFSAECLSCNIEVSVKHRSGIA